MSVAQSQTSASATCWHCSADAAGALFCPSCGAVQAFADDTDYFTALAFPHSPVIDRTALDQRYYELSRKLHPDRYQTSAPAAQAASAANTALVNRAYRTLRDPVERGRYWLQLRGVDAAPRQTNVPASLAAIVFQVQEQLEQFRTSGAAQRPALIKDLAGVRARIADAETKGIEQLQDNLAQWQGTGERAALTTSLARILADIAYIRALLRDIDKALDT